MNIPFPDIQGFAGATGVGLLVLVGMYLLVIVFADNLPSVANAWIQRKEWGGLSFVPLVLVAYVIGLLAMALVGSTLGQDSTVVVTAPAGASVNEYVQLKQEAAILSGAVAAFALLAVAAVAQAFSWRGWAPTLIFSAILSAAVACGSYKMAYNKMSAASELAAKLSTQQPIKAAK